MSTPIIIAIDGPAGAGKSTTARKVAEQLGYVHVDTGAMYRAVTLAVVNSNSEPTEENVRTVMESMTIHLKVEDDGQHTYLNGEDVTNALRQQSVTDLVSKVSSYSSVRRRLVQKQRELGLSGGIVMDGRDIGSVVFPNAHVKVYLVADLEERSRRRLEELKAKGQQVDAAAIRTQIEERDRLDSQRAESPLIKPDGAHEIDTTNLSIDEQVAKIVKLAKSYLMTDSMISGFGNL